MKRNLLKYGIVAASMLGASAVALNTVGVIAPAKVEAAKSLAGDFYKISYPGNELEISFSGDIRSYKGLSVTAIKDLKDDLEVAIGSIVSNSLQNAWDPLIAPDEMVTTFDIGSVTPLMAAAPEGGQGVPSTYVAECLIPLVSVAYLGSPDYPNGDESRILEYLDSPEQLNSLIEFMYVFSSDRGNLAIKDNIFANVAGVAGREYNQMKYSQYLKDGNLGSYEDDLRTSFLSALENADVTKTYELSEIINYISMIDYAAENSKDAESASHEFYTSDVIDMLDNLRNKNLGGSGSTSNTFINTGIPLLTTANSKDLTNFFTKLEYSTVAYILLGTTKAEFLKILDNITLSAFLDICKGLTSNELTGIEAFAYLVKYAANFGKGISVAEFNAFLDKIKNGFAAKSLLRAMDKLTVDSFVIMQDGQFILDNIQDFLRAFPRIEDILAKPEGDLKLSWNIKAETAIGDFQTKLTLGIYGDETQVRRVLQLLADTIDFNFSEDGEFTLIVTTPNALAEFVREFMNGSSIPNELKSKAFKFVNSTIEEMYNYINNYLYADFIADLKKIDYIGAAETLMTADILNEVFNTCHFTDDRLDRLVNKFMQLLAIKNHVSFDLFMNFVSEFIEISSYRQDQLEGWYDRFINVLNQVEAKNIDAATLREFIATGSNERVYDIIDRLQDNEGIFTRAKRVVNAIYRGIPSRFYDNCLMDAYQGNGVIAASGNIRFNFEDVFNAVSPTYGERAYEGISAFFDEIPTTVNLDLTLNATDFYQVTFHYNDGTFMRGLLPAGVNLDSVREGIHCDTVDILYWMDENGDEVNFSKAKDMEVWAYTDFRVDITSDEPTEKLFDKDPIVLTCNAYPTYDAYTYQWYKNGNPVQGATKPVLEILEGKDSGDYTCEVMRTKDLLEHTTDPVTVFIQYDHIEIKDIKWDYNPDTPFVYDGKSHTVSLNEKDLPADVKVAYGGVMSAVNAGKYHATAILYSNYYSFMLDGQIFYDIEWEIKPQEIELPEGVVWDYDSAEPFVFDGTAKSVAIDETQLPAHVVVDSYEDNVKTNAGEYQAVVTLKTDSPNYVIKGETEYTLDWEVSKQVVNVDDLAWDYNSKTPYTFDETAVDGQMVELKDFAASNLVDVSYEDNSKYNAGTYTAVATLTLRDADNFVFADGNSTFTSQLQWQIKPKTISVSGVGLATLEGDTAPLYSLKSGSTTIYTYYYDGARHGFRLTNVPQHVLVTYGSDSVSSATDVCTSDSPYAYGYFAQYGGVYIFDAYLVAENDNYVLSGSTNKWLFWMVAYQQISLTNIQKAVNALNNTSFVYDGTIKSVYSENINELAEAAGLGITWYSNFVTVGGKIPNFEAINVGSYDAVFAVSVLNPNYIIVVGSSVYQSYTFSFAWSITPFDLEVTSSDLYLLGVDENATVTYDGLKHNVKLDVYYLPEEIQIGYLGDLDKVNAGVYETTAILMPISNNYTINGRTSLTINISWAITPAPIYTDAICWNYADTFVYNGEEFSVALVEGTISEHLVVSYEGTLKATNAGQYVAVAKLATESANYEIIGNSTFRLNWRVQKVKLNMNLIAWNYYDAIVYDRAEHTVQLLKVSYDFNKIDVTYSGAYFATDAGKYVAKVNFALKDEFATNYELINAGEKTLTWEIVERAVPTVTWNSTEVEGGKSLAVVMTNESLSKEVFTLHVDKLELADLEKADFSKVYGKNRNVTVYSYYDVYFLDSKGDRADLTGTYTTNVQLLLSAEAKELLNGKFDVVAVGDDLTLTDLSVINDGSDYIRVSTPILGEFAIVSVSQYQIPWWMYGILGLAGAYIIAAGAYIIFKKDE